MLQHRSKLFPGFTARYNINRLVYYETSGDIVAAIAREKQIKSWGRMKKIALIESANRDWKDLSEAWYGGSATMHVRRPRQKPERDSSAWLGVGMTPDPPTPQQHRLKG